MGAPRQPTWGGGGAAFGVLAGTNSLPWIGTSVTPQYEEKARWWQWLLPSPQKKNPWWAQEPEQPKADTPTATRRDKEQV